VGNPRVVGRFMQLIVRILVDVYAASVITTVRIKTLMGFLKTISYLEADEIKRILTVSAGFLTQESWATESVEQPLTTCSALSSSLHCPTNIVTDAREDLRRVPKLYLS
jgi:hypothetical protein